MAEKCKIGHIISATLLAESVLYVCKRVRWVMAWVGCAVGEKSLLMRFLFSPEEHNKSNSNVVTCQCLPFFCSLGRMPCTVCLIFAKALAHDRIIRHVNKEMQFRLNHSIAFYGAYCTVSVTLYLCVDCCHTFHIPDGQKYVQLIESLACTNDADVNYIYAHETQSRGNKKKSQLHRKHTSISLLENIFKCFTVDRANESTTKTKMQKKIESFSAAFRIFISPLF